ncbi:hemicentin-1-like isoform X1 [Corticium candelabrum]|uniref:hemicentin-1-like isoform X1 n=2 Tax=Corticium candelabrum TaxID=121492 RepID=UPI002E25D7E0|nr:hemicentin-1-like isoform X1 [Corticium candelabrum]
MVFKALYLNALCLFTLQFARTSTSNQQYRSVGFIVDVGSGMSRRLAQQLEQELRTALKGNMRSFSRYALALVSRRGSHQFFTTTSSVELSDNLDLQIYANTRLLCREAVPSAVLEVANAVRGHTPATLFVFTIGDLEWSRRASFQVLTHLSDVGVQLTVIVLDTLEQSVRETYWSHNLNHSNFNSLLHLTKSEIHMLSKLLDTLTSKVQSHLLHTEDLPMGNSTVELRLNNQYDSLLLTSDGRLDSVAVQTQDGETLAFLSAINLKYGYAGSISQDLSPGLYLLHIVTSSSAIVTVRSERQLQSPRFCEELDDVCFKTTTSFSPVKGTLYYVITTLDIVFERYQVSLDCKNCIYDMVATMRSLHTETRVRVPVSPFHLDIIGSSLAAEQITRYKIRPVDLEAPRALLQSFIVTITAGQELQLICATSSPDNLNTYSWRFPTTLEYQAKDENNGRVVTISNVRVQHEGDYHCKVENSKGYTELTFSVNVQGVPVVAASLEIVSVSVGEEVNLPCPAFGRPLVIKWLKEGKELGKSSRHEVTDNGTLTILRTTTSDSGIYLCMVTNPFGNTTKTTQLIAKSLAAVRSVKVRVGKPAYLDCQLSDGLTQDTDVTWWSGATMIPEQSETFSVLENGTLIIKAADYFLRGLYSCSVGETTTGYSADYLLSVLEPPTILDYGFNAVTAAEGEELLIACTATGFPPPSYGWSINSMPLSEIGRGRISVTTSGSLFFETVSNSDEGNYTCTATNALGSDSQSFSVIVEGPPYFDVKDGPTRKSVRGVLGSALTLACPIRGYPVPGFVWFFDRRRIARSDRISLDLSGSLDIRKLEETDEGSYSCKAVNTYGQKEFKFELVVEIPPKASSKHLEVRGVEGQPLTLECNVLAVPLPEVKWSKVKKQGKNSLLATNETLLISSLQVDDGGDYKCKASNYIGSVTVNVHVVVAVPPHIEPLPHNIADIAIPIGSTLTIPCVASGFPLPEVEWKLRSKTVKFEVLDGEMNVVDFTKADVGDYTCVAKNEAGRSRRHLQMTIDESVEFVTWSQWSACTRTCSGGVQVRRKQQECLSPDDACPDLKEIRSCSDQILCPVDGQWSDWSLTGCSETCGGGFRWRYRECNNPPPNDAGRSCVGQSRKLEICNNECCPVNGEWSDWSSWSRCSKSCGRPFGTRSRTRKCDNPPPECSGRTCSGHNNDNQPCNRIECAVNGGWSPWNLWSPCTQSCTGGFKTRIRICNNPRPHYGGKSCSGFAHQSSVCNAQACPVNGEWSYWQTWSACSRSCRPGGQRNRRRSCSNPTPQHGGRTCSGFDVDRRDCNSQSCPLNGGWTAWSTWQLCSHSCGGGQTLRVRSCTNPRPDFGGQRCPGENSQNTACNRIPCPVDGKWSTWSQWTPFCSPDKCQGSNQQRRRKCDSPPPANAGRTCPGHDTDTRPCGGLLCPVNGGWGEWNSYTQCTKTCGGGQRTRYRRCDNPRPLNNGLYCVGSDVETSNCNTQCCAVHGGWSEWTSWTNCDLACRSSDAQRGWENRRRSCSNPRPQCEGMECPGSNIEQRQCSPPRCPINGGWSSWAFWSACSVTCKGGTRFRDRLCTNPRPQFGGTKCPGNSRQNERCNEVCCPVAGVWSAWNAWSVCSVTCAQGIRKRQRACNNPAPSCSGKSCDGFSELTEWCNERCCPIAGGWGSWSSWSSCRASCGRSTRIRNRLCNNPAPVCGGSFCGGSTQDVSSCCNGNCYAQASRSQYYTYYAQSAYQSRYRESCGFLDWDRCTRYRTSYRSSSRRGHRASYFTLTTSTC